MKYIDHFDEPTLKEFYIVLEDAGEESLHMLVSRKKVKLEFK